MYVDSEAEANLKILFGCGKKFLVYVVTTLSNTTHASNFKSSLNVQHTLSDRIHPFCCNNDGTFKDLVI